MIVSQQIPNAAGALRLDVSCRRLLQVGRSGGWHADCRPIGSHRRMAVSVMKTPHTNTPDSDTPDVEARPPWQARLPFFYGWIIVGLAFFTTFFGIGLTWAAS